MINEKNKFLTVSWLSGLLSAEIFISTGEWGVQMPPLTSENSHFLRSGPHEAILVMVLIKLRSSLQSNYATDYAENTHVTMFLREVNIG